MVVAPLVITAIELLMDLTIDPIIRAIVKPAPVLKQEEHPGAVELRSQISAAQDEIAGMNREAEALNNPTTFAKYSKLQR